MAWGLLAGGDMLSPVRGWIGVAVFLGCVTHVAGDALTRAGVPIFWPLRIRGQRWFRVGLPYGWRFRTGSQVEKRWVFGAFMSLGVLLFPGVLPVVVSVTGSTLSAI